MQSTAVLLLSLSGAGTLYVTLQGDDTGRVLTVVALHAAERMGHLRAPSSPAV